MTIILVKKEIRRALEAAMKNAVETAGLVPNDVIKWPGREFNRSTKTHYFDCGIVWGEVLVTEMGGTPRFHLKGALSINVHTPFNLGPDESDKYSGYIAAGFPYGASLVFGTTNPVTVHVDKIEPGSYGRDDGWLTSTMSIDWDVYRRG